MNTKHLHPDECVREVQRGSDRTRRGETFGEHQKMVYETKLSPIPWHIEEKDYVFIDKNGKKNGKKKAWFIFDANGNPVRRTYTNMQHICDCVNKAQKENSHEPAGL